MPQPKLGFALTVRNYKEYTKRKIVGTIKNRGWEIVGLIISIVALCFSIAANKIAKSAFDLAQKDKSQQIQIDLLKKAIDSIHTQNQISNQQLDKLIAISTGTNKQLDLNLRNEKTALEKEKALKESDLIVLRAI